MSWGAFLLGVALWIAYVVGVHKGILLGRAELSPTDGGEGR